jgi:hypothetical protein
MGWFSYRRNSSHRLSMREKAVHLQLASSCKHVESKGKELVVYGVQWLTSCMEYCRLYPGIDH